MSGKTSTARIEEGISLQQRTIFKTEQVPSCWEVRVNSRSHREVKPFPDRAQNTRFHGECHNSEAMVTGEETLLSRTEGLQSCGSDYIHLQA